MFIKSFPVGSFQCNCIILGDQESKEAIIVDPGDDAENIVAEIKKQNFDVKYIIHTHAHIDHIGATAKIHKELKGQVCLHKEDAPLYQNISMQAQMLGLSNVETNLPDPIFFNHGDVLECHKNLKTKVLYTPGHSPGSVCFLMDKLEANQTSDSKNQKKSLLLSGDTLFMESIGRTDLWGGDQKQLIASIKEKLLVLPPETLVIPGHGPQTTIGHELKNNPFFQ